MFVKICILSLAKDRRSILIMVRDCEFDRDAIPSAEV
jgi:hypothetical protein